MSNNIKISLQKKEQIKQQNKTKFAWSRYFKQSKDNHIKTLQHFQELERVYNNSSPIIQEQLQKLYKKMKEDISCCICKEEIQHDFNIGICGHISHNDCIGDLKYLGGITKCIKCNRI